MSLSNGAQQLVQDTDFNVADVSASMIVLRLVDGKTWYKGVTSLSLSTELVLESITLDGYTRTVRVPVGTLEPQDVQVGVTEHQVPAVFPYLFISAKPREYLDCFEPSLVSLTFLNSSLQTNVDFEVLRYNQADQNYVLWLRGGHNWGKPGSQLFVSTLTCGSIGEVPVGDILVANIIHNTTEAVVVNSMATNAERQRVLGTIDMQGELSVISETLEVMGTGFGSSVSNITAIDIRTTERPLTSGTDFVVLV